MAILVTGGAGYIGSHTVKALQRQGRDVVVLDNLYKGHRQALKDVPLHIGDLGDPAFIQGVFEKHPVDAVVHFAALSLVGESVERPDLYFRNNTAYALNLLDAMVKNGVINLVFSSTAAVYGEPNNVPIDEAHPKAPTNPYGESKLFVEQILQRYSEAFGVRSVSLRYFNAAGADPSGEIGEDHQPETHLIPIILQTLLGKREHIQIFGTDYPTADGTCIRDYIHVNDLSDAHILALDALARGRETTAYNLGSGQGFSVREVIQCVERVTGKQVPVVESPRRPGDPAVLVASSERIKQDLQWDPKYEKLEAIIETAWQWHKEHPDGFAD